MSILKTKKLTQLRWLFLSPKERYARLWASTKKLGSLDYTIRNVATGASKKTEPL